MSGIHRGEPQTGTSEWASQSSPCPTPSDGGEREAARLSWGAHDLQRRGNPSQSSVPQSPGSPQGRGAAAQLRCYIHCRSPPHPTPPHPNRALREVPSPPTPLLHEVFPHTLTWLKRWDSTVSGKVLVRPESCRPSGGQCK